MYNETKYLLFSVLKALPHITTEDNADMKVCYCNPLFLLLIVFLFVLLETNWDDCQSREWAKRPRPSRKDKEDYPQLSKAGTVNHFIIINNHSYLFEIIVISHFIQIRSRTACSQMKIIMQLWERILFKNLWIMRLTSKRPPQIWIVSNKYIHYY